MSHRRKSACCCDGKQGPCFLGYGTVPKTDYMREYIPGVRNRCAEGSDIESGFPEEPECQKNYHDNWAFCDPTKEEELVLFIERPEYNFSTTCAPQTPSPCVECDPPDCCNTPGGCEFKKRYSVASEEFVPRFRELSEAFIGLDIDIQLLREIK